MATRLDAAASAAATTLAYSISAGLGNRCLIVGVQTEGTQSGNFTCTYGGQSMVHLVQTIAGSGTTQQTVGLFFLNDAGIEAASGTTITPGNTGTPGDLTIHARSYQECVQTTPTNTDSDSSGAATPNPLAALDIVTSNANAIVCALSGMGNVGGASWASPLTEQTDQADASSQASFADDEVPTGTTIACECTWTGPNRMAAVAVGIEHASAEGISSVSPSEFDFDNTDVDIVGSNFEASQGSGAVYISDASTLAGSVNEVEIDGAINTWADALINLDFSGMSQTEIDNLHTLGPSATRYIIVTNNSADEYSSQITLHRPQAIQMVLGAATPGTTTARLTGMTGTFGGGRIEETAAQNPSTTNTDVADDGNREDVWSIEAKTGSRATTYDFRVLYGGVVADTITQTPQLTVSVSADVTALPGVGSLTLTGSAPTATTTQHRIIAVPVGSLSLSGEIPTAQVSDHHIVTPDVGSLAVTGQEPTVTTTQNHVIAVPVGSLTASGQAPTVTATQHHVIAVPVGTLTITGYAPAVSLPVAVFPELGTLVITGYVPDAALTDHHIRAPPLGALSLTGLAPTATTTQNHVISIPVGSLTLSGQAPTRNVGQNHIVQPGAGSLALTGQEPTASTTQNHVIPVPSGSITISGEIPSLSYSWTIVPGTGALVATGQAPVSQSGDSRIRQVPVGSLILSGKAPTATTTENHIVSVPVGSLAVSGKIPTATTTLNHVAQPGTGSLVLDGKVPTATTTAGEDLTEQPGVGSLILSGKVPTLSYSWVVTPGTGSLTLSGNAPTLSYSWVTSPGKGALVLSGKVPTATTTQNHVAQPGKGALALSGKTPTATTTLNHVVQPGVGTLTLSGEIPTINLSGGNLVVTPGVGSLAVTGHVPDPQYRVLFEGLSGLAGNHINVN